MDEIIGIFNFPLPINTVTFRVARFNIEGEQMLIDYEVDSDKEYTLPKRVVDGIIKIDGFTFKETKTKCEGHKCQGHKRHQCQCQGGTYWKEKIKKHLSDSCHALTVLRDVSEEKEKEKINNTINDLQLLKCEI